MITKNRFSDVEIEELCKCYNDPLHFIETYCKIQTPYGRKDLILTPKQKYYLKLIERHKILVIKKERQVGYTTLVAAYVLWYSMFNSDSNAFIGTPRTYMSRDIIHIVDDMHLDLPDFMQHQVEKYGKTAFRYDNGSNIVGGSIDRASVSGLPFNIAFLDEAAYVTGSNLSDAFNLMYRYAVSGSSKLIISSSIGGAPHGDDFEKIYNLFPNARAYEDGETLMFHILAGDIQESGVSVGIVDNG